MLLASRSRSVAVIVFLLAALPFAAMPVQAAPREGASPPPARDIDYYGWWHDAGELWLHSSNLAFVGAFGAALDEPSANWPGGSPYEHMFVCGLWVGAASGGDTLVSAAVYQMEFLPPLEDSLYVVYESQAGAPGGDKDIDDDGDGAVDEDRLDGLDNDGDLLIDEDYAAISDQMFASVCFDTVTSPNPSPVDPHYPLGLEVYTQSFAWDDPGCEDFVGMRYEIKNISDSVLEDVYLGVMADLDVGNAGGFAHYLDDLAGYLDTVVSTHPGVAPVRVVMPYVYDAPGGDDGDWDGWFGVALLDHSDTGAEAPVVHAVRTWESGSEDPDHDRDRYRFMSEPGFDGFGLYPDDWRCLMSVGPLEDLAPGESAFIELALVAGHKLEGLTENAARAVLLHRSRLWGGGAARSPREFTEALEPPSRAAAAPAMTALYPPSPNPISGSTRISFRLAESCHAQLSVYDCAGRKVAALVDHPLGAGPHSVSWEEGITSLPAGLYFVRLVAGEKTATTKAVLAR